MIMIMSLTPSYLEHVIILSSVTAGQGWDVKETCSSVCPFPSWLGLHPEQGLPSLQGVGGGAGSNSSQIQAISHHPICCSHLPQFCQDSLVSSAFFSPFHSQSRWELYLIDNTFAVFSRWPVVIAQFIILDSLFNPGNGLSVVIGHSFLCFMSF